jgi:hypothetical protein
MTERHLELALDERRQDARLLRRRPSPRDELAAESHRRQVRLDEERLAQRLHHHHHVHGGAAEAAVLRCKRNAENPHLGQRGPDVLAVAGGAAHDLGPRVEAITRIEEFA